jgi:hypothetical protein
VNVATVVYTLCAFLSLACAALLLRAPFFVSRRRDDLPRTGSNRYGGFESGLCFSNGRKKLAYRGFRLPMVARRAGRRVRLWVHVRPHDGRVRVEIEYRNRHGKWRRLKRDRAGRRGYWVTTTRYRRGRSYRVRWRSPTGARLAGSPTRPIRWRR